MVFCTKCGTSCRDGSKFCTKCGNALPTRSGSAIYQAPPSTAFNLPPPVNSAYNLSVPSTDVGSNCPSCKKMQKPGQKFCTICGFKLGSASTEVSPSSVSTPTPTSNPPPTIPSINLPTQSAQSSSQRLVPSSSFTSSCSSCSKPLKPGAKFCTSCGKKVIESQVPLQPQVSSQPQTLSQDFQSQPSSQTSIPPSIQTQPHLTSGSRIYKAPLSQPQTSAESGSQSDISLTKKTNVPGLGETSRNLSDEEIISKLMSGVKEYKNLYAEEQEKVAKLESKLKTLVDAIKEDREAQKRASENWHKEREELEERANQAENSLFQLLETIKQERAVKEEQLKQEQQEHLNTQQKAKFLQERIDRLVESTKKQAQTQDENAALINKIATLEKELSQNNDIISKLKSELSNEKDRSQSILTSLEEKHQRQEATISELQLELTKTLDRLKETEKSLGSDTSVIQNLTAELDLTKSQLKQKQNELLEETKKAKEFRTQSQENEELLFNEKRLTSQLQNQILELEKQLEFLKPKEGEDTPVSSAEMTRLEEELNEATLKITELQETLEDQREQSEGLAETLRNSLDQNSSLKQALDEAQMNLDRQASIIRDLEKKLANSLSNSSALRTSSSTEGETVVIIPSNENVIDYQISSSVIDAPPPPPLPSNEEEPIQETWEFIEAPPPPPPPGIPAPPGISSSGPKVELPVPGMKASVPMKSVNWARIPQRTIDQTVFAQMDVMKLDLDYKSIESLFCAKLPEEKIKKNEEKTSKVIHLIEPKRQQNVGIFLNTVKRAPEEIKRAVKKLDEDNLAPCLTQLIESIPTQEELALIRQYIEKGGDAELLGEAEQFFHIIDAPALKEQLTSLQYKITFQSKVSEYKTKLNTVLNGIIDVKKSQSLIKLLEIVLAIGNFLNGQKKGAFGFKIDSLNKLADTKTVDNQSTLLHYLVIVLNSKFPEVINNIQKELTSTKEVVLVSFSGVSTDVQDLKSGLTLVQNAVSVVPQLDPNATAFTSMFTPSLIDTFKHNIEDLASLVNQVNEQFGELEIKFRGERSSTPDEFFTQLHKFLQNLNSVHAENEVKKVQEERVQQRKNKMHQKLLEEIHKGVQLKPVAKEPRSKRARGREDVPTLRTKASNVQSEMAKIQMVALQMQRKRQDKDSRAKRASLGPSKKLDKLLSEFAKTEYSDS